MGPGRAARGRAPAEAWDALKAAARAMAVVEVWAQVVAEGAWVVLRSDRAATASARNAERP